MSAAAAAGLRCAKGSSEARSSHRQSPNENTSALIEYLVHCKKNESYKLSEGIHILYMKHIYISQSIQNLCTSWVITEGLLLPV